MKLRLRTSTKSRIDYYVVSTSRLIIMLLAGQDKYYSGDDVGKIGWGKIGFPVEKCEFYFMGYQV